MSASALLPAEFADLEPFAADWAPASAIGRVQLRDNTSAAQQTEFYSAARDRLAAALAYLDRKPLAALDEQETRLMNLMLGLVHISLSVELQGSDEPKHMIDRKYMKIVRALADIGA